MRVLLGPKGGILSYKGRGVEEEEEEEETIGGDRGGKVRTSSRSSTRGEGASSYYEVRCLGPGG